MPITPTDLREIYGSVFVTEAPDGMIIPWKPLSLGDFLEYDSQFKHGITEHSVLENEIFCKCVTDSILVRNIHLQKAGTISLVVRSIMEHSGPTTINEMNNIMNHYRDIANQPIHQLVTVICRAFPGYTPDDIYQMDFHKMALRLAQAENKLITLGLMTEPIQILPPGAEEQVQQQEKPKLKIDPKKLKEAFDLQETQPMSKIIKKARAEGAKKLDLSKGVEEEELDLGSTVDGEQFVVSTGMMAAGLEVGDDDLARQMKKDAKSIYGDYLKMGNKVKMKTQEERIQEAHKRMEANKRKNIQAAQKRKKK